MSYYKRKYSKLEWYISSKLEQFFSHYTIRRNIRPEWMYDITKRRLELDFLIEEINVAIEVQGGQHYEYVPMFHGTYDNYLDQQERDRLKREGCYKYGIHLFEVFDKESADSILSYIQMLFIPPIPEHLEGVLKKLGSIRLPKANESYLSLEVHDTDHRTRGMPSFVDKDDNPQQNNGIDYQQDELKKANRARHNVFKKPNEESLLQCIISVQTKLEDVWDKEQGKKRGGYVCYNPHSKRFDWQMKPKYIARAMNESHIFFFWVSESYVVEAQRRIRV